MNHLAPHIAVSRFLLPNVTSWRGLVVSLYLLAAAFLTPAPARAAVVASVAADRLDVVGDGADDTITLRLLAGDATRIEVLVGGAAVGDFARDTFATILVDGGGGNDVISLEAVNGLFTDIEITTVRGGLGNDVLIGQASGETLQGGGGNDTLLGGDGDDTFVWNPGDGSDTVEGQGGSDTLVFNGSAANEVVAVSANGQRVRLTRDVAAIVMDVGSTELIVVNAFGGIDTVTAGTGLASLTTIRFDGGDADDTITGGDANDTLLGGAGLDTINGGAGNDTLVGGPGNDTIFGGAGNDRIVWNDGDGTDLYEGGADTDVVEVNGSSGATGDVFTITPNGLRVRFDRTGLVPFFLDIGTTESIVANGLAGDDSISGANGLAALVALTLDGGDGNDTITGSDGNDTIFGGAGNDAITPGRGDDTNVHGGDGDDTFTWNPGDGNDALEGEGGVDTLVFNGSNVGETVAISANGQRVTLTRNVASIVMDIGSTEQIVVNALGGIDTLTAGTGLASLTTIRFDGGDADDVITGGDGNDTLIGGAGLDTISGGAGDDTILPGLGNDVVAGGPGDDTFTWNPGDGSDTLEGEGGTDTLQFNGSAADEIMTASANGQRVTFTRDVGGIVMDLGSIERLVVSALGGIDRFTAGAGLAPSMTIRVDGGDGDDIITGGDGSDTLLGGAGVDTISGGAGDDTLTGGPGNDTIFGGPGNDRMIWNDGDASDVNEGGPGTDATEVNGSTSVTTGDVFSVAANGMRVKFDRTNLVPFSLDIGTVEQLLVKSLAGSDTIGVGGGLAALVSVTIDGGTGADALTASVTSIVNAIGGSEPDTLTVNAENQPVMLVGSAVLLASQVRTTYSEIETVNFTSTVSALPSVSVANAPATATSSFIKVSGTAADDAPGASVTWSNDRGGSGRATGTTTWAANNVPLQTGANAISVTVEDASGNRVTTSFTVTVTALSYYLAEGATGAFFDLDILIANPNSVPAPVTITFLKEDGTTVTQVFTVAASSQLPIRVDDIPGLEQTAVSTVVTSTNAVPLVVERTMQWDAQHYGSHGGTAVDGPRTRWVFAEGSEGFFNTYVLLANANDAAATVTVTFLRESGSPVVRSFQVGPTSRFNVVTGAIAELVNQSFSIVVDSTLPIIAERAMYFGTARFWDGGHESAGVPEGATSWFLAEGATGTFFDTYVLVGNPNATAARVTLTFLTDLGTSVTRTMVLDANRRLTVNIEDQDPTLANVAVATTVSSDLPVVVERAMYWPGNFTQWYEAHNSFGTTELGTRWGLSEGRVGFQDKYETYILLANPSTTQAADVSVTFLRANGSPLVKSYTVGPTTRFNVHVNSMVPELANETFGALIEVRNGVGIAVERAMYSNALNATWGAGTNAPATRLP